MLRRLQKSDFEAYLVGGGVRDLLLGKSPKDFDIATNARPNQIRKLFKNCRLIGKRFRLAHLYFKDELIETATFRADHSNAQEHEGKQRNGMLVRDNVYGDLEEDVWRRDFTVNALYYDVFANMIVDYCNGVTDIENKCLNCIGDPNIRFQEDPVRILRAVRLSNKLDLKIAENIKQGIVEHKNLLNNIAAARLFEEMQKLTKEGYAHSAFQQLRHYDLLMYLCPSLNSYIEEHPDSNCQKLVEGALINTDSRIKIGKSITPAFLYAVFLWYPLQAKIQHYIEKDQLSPAMASQEAAGDVIREQVNHTAIPKRFTRRIRDMWHLQYPLTRLNPKRIYRTFQHPAFRASYDFLLLRNEAGEDLQEYADWWTQFQKVKPKAQKSMIAEIQKP